MQSEDEGVLAVVEASATRRFVGCGALYALGAVLLVGALLQAFWAATYLLANLGPATGLAVAARAFSLAIYSVAAFVAGAEMGAFGHALAFTVATSLGSWHLWLRLRRRFGVDASARSLWQRPEATWRTV